MIKRKSTFFLGIFIFLIPFLGLPTSAKTFLITLSSLGLIAMSVKVSLPKKQIKTKIKKEKVTPVFSQNAPIFLRQNMPDIVEPKEDLSQKTETE